MKFEEAFNKTFEIEKVRNEKKGMVFAIQPGTAKVLAFFWNMVKVAGGKLDDFVAIDENNNIIQVDKPKEKKSKDSKEKEPDKEKEKDPKEPEEPDKEEKENK